jgi:hypothetical protein
MAHSNVMPSPVALPGVSKIVAVGSGKGMLCSVCKTLRLHSSLGLTLPALAPGNPDAITCDLETKQKLV